MFVKAALVAMILSMTAQAQQLRLTVGTNPDGAPMSFHDSNSGRYRGVSVDLLAEIAKDAGFQVEHAPMPLAELIPALNDHRIDVIAANLLATPQRRALIDFSETYHSGGDALVVPKSDPGEYKSIADLKGMVIGAQKGSAQLAAVQSTGLFSDIKVFDNIDAVMHEVSAGRIAAGIVGGMVSSPVAALVPGGRLEVEWNGSGRAYLTGPAARVFETSLEVPDAGPR